jgi:hypothetical protein
MSSAILDDYHANYTLQPIIKWKGKTFTQITSSIKKNVGKTGSGTHNLMMPNPLKIYRREIANPKIGTTCSRRASLKIDELNRPGGSIINSTGFTVGTTNGLVNTMDNKLPNNTCEEPGTCLAFLSPALNAKRRCRSAGMVHQKYGTNNLPKYFTNASQYLYSRNQTFEQNQFQYPVSDPNYCVTYNPSNKQFAQDGGVTASSLIARVKYNAINTAAAQMKNPLGIATSNALAYGVPESGYTIKDKLGYPNRTYPSFKANLMRKCTDKHIRSF